MAATCTAPPARAASICCSPIRKAAAPIAPIAAWRAIARPSATTPTATSSASTGRRCPTTRCSTSSPRGGDGGRFHRMCISMITHPRSDDDTRVVLRKWTERIKHVPVSILSNPTTMTRLDVQELHDLGADIFTVALDACNPEVFDRTRGRGVQSPHSWDKYWEILYAAKEIFGPEKFGAHLIVGMGESDHDVLTQVQTIRDLGGHSHMFAFFPEKGSLMDHLPPVPRPQWRRIQLARYLIDYRDHRLEQMRFDEQRQAGRFRPAAGRGRRGDQGRHRLPHLRLPGQGGRGHFRLRPPLWRFAAAATSPPIRSSSSATTSAKCAGQLDKRHAGLEAVAVAHRPPAVSRHRHRLARRARQHRVRPGADRGAQGGQDPRHHPLPALPAVGADRHPPDPRPRDQGRLLQGQRHRDRAPHHRRRRALSRRGPDRLGAGVRPREPRPARSRAK